MRWLGKSRFNDDRGAVVVLVGILLAGGVLSGLLAIVVDMGRVYTERRVVLNAADAGALALAQHCAKGDSRCNGDTTAAWLTSLSGANSPDGATSVSLICGASSKLGTCPPTTTKWNDCQPVDSTFTNWVRVRTRTQSAGGDLFFPAIFAGLLDGSNKELAVSGCSQAAWGPPATAEVPLPFMLPICPGVPGGSAIVIEDFDPNDPNQDCTLGGSTYSQVTKGMAFADFPGANKVCGVPVNVSIGDVIPVETSLAQVCGNNKEIEATLDALIASGHPVILPVVGAHAPAGQGQYEFTVISFKSFTFLGYNLKNTEGGVAPGLPDYPLGWKSTACTTGKRSCLYGVVGYDVIPGGVGGGVNTGVLAIEQLP